MLLLSFSSAQRAGAAARRDREFARAFAAIESGTPFFDDEADQRAWTQFLREKAIAASRDPAAIRARAATLTRYGVPYDIAYSYSAMVYEARPWTAARGTEEAFFKETAEGGLQQLQAVRPATRAAYQRAAAKMPNWADLLPKQGWELSDFLGLALIVAPVAIYAAAGGFAGAGAGGVVEGAAVEVFAAPAVESVGAGAVVEGAASVGVGAGASATATVGGLVSQVSAALVPLQTIGKALAAGLGLVKAANAGESVQAPPAVAPGEAQDSQGWLWTGAGLIGAVILVRLLRG